MTQGSPRSAIQAADRADMVLPDAKKNFRWCILIVGFGFVGVFMAFNTTQALATSLPGGPPGMATACLGVLYVVFTVACFLVPPVVEKLGIKASLLLGGLMYLPMILAPLKQTYAVWMPANVLVGLGAPLLWTACGLYVGRCSQWEAAQSGKPKEECTSAFNGLFMSLYQANGVVGLLIGGMVLQDSSLEVVHILFVALACVCAVGALLMLAVPQVQACSATAGLLDEAPSKSSAPTMLGTLRQALTVPRMTLLVPLIFYNGLSLGFLMGSFTGKICTPVLGIAFSGYCIAAFYGTNAVFSYAFGQLSSTIGRRPIMVSAAILHLIFYMLLMFVEGQSMATVWLLTLVFAVSDSVWETFPNAIAQGFFSDDDAEMSAAMANFKGWQSCGMATQFLLGMPGVLGSTDATCVRNNAIILTIALVISIVCLTVLDRRVASLDPVMDARQVAVACKDHVEP